MADFASGFEYYETQAWRDAQAANARLQAAIGTEGAGAALVDYVDVTAGRRVMEEEEEMSEPREYGVESGFIGGTAGGGGGVYFPTMSVPEWIGELGNLGRTIWGQQVASQVPARRPPANVTLFSGECPPGMVPRKVAWGRDKCIKKPRMNPLNRPALSRASRRVSGFLRIAKGIEAGMRRSFGPALKRPASKRGGKCVGCARPAQACVC